jgi:hypothetical protein
MGGKVGLGRSLIGLHAASAFLFAEPLSSLQRPSPQLFTGCVKFRALLLCDILMFGKKIKQDRDLGFLTRRKCSQTLTASCIW